MSTPRSTEDLRDELRRQASATASWDLPALPHPQRRTSPWRAGGAMLMTAALVVGVLLVVPSWFRGEQDVAGRQPAPESTPDISQLDWERTGPTCLAETPECAVPGQVVSDGLALRRTAMGVGDPLGQAGEPYAFRQRAGGDSAEEVWVMVGVLDGAASDGTYPRMTVDLGVARVEVARSDSPFTLFRVGRSRPDPFQVEVSSPSAPRGGRLVVARFEPVEAGPRTDWVSTTNAVESCGVSARCLDTSSLVVDGIDLVRSEDGAEGAGELRGEFQRPLPGAWFMLGAAEADDGGPLLVSVGDGDPVAVPVDRPVLVRAPDGTRPAYRVRTEDGRPLPLFMRLYRLAES